MLCAHVHLANGKLTTLRRPGRHEDGDDRCISLHRAVHVDSVDGVVGVDGVDGVNDEQDSSPHLHHHHHHCARQGTLDQVTNDTVQLLHVLVALVLASDQKVHKVSNQVHCHLSHHLQVHIESRMDWRLLRTTLELAAVMLALLSRAILDPMKCVAHVVHQLIHLGTLEYFPPVLGINMAPGLVVRDGDALAVHHDTSVHLVQRERELLYTHEGFHAMTAQVANKESNVQADDRCNHRVNSHPVMHMML